MLLFKAINIIEYVKSAMGIPVWHDALCMLMHNFSVIMQKKYSALSTPNKTLQLGLAISIAFHINNNSGLCLLFLESTSSFLIAACVGSAICGVLIILGCAEICQKHSGFKA